MAIFKNILFFYPILQQSQYGQMQYPKNQMEFEDWFSTEEKCRDYLISLKWSGGFVCDGCRGETYWNKNRGRIVCRKCRREHYLLADTIFQSSHKPLHLWFRAMWGLLRNRQESMNPVIKP